VVLKSRERERERERDVLDGRKLKERKKDIRKLSVLEKKIKIKPLSV
jgi:hypothetical protein